MTKSGLPIVFKRVSRASKKSKSADFGFFLYLLAKIAFYWLFSQNNRSMEANHLFRILLWFWCVLCTETKQVKKSPPKCLLKVSNRETRFFCWGKFFAFLVAKPSISVLGYMKGCRKILLRNFGADRQLFKKTVLGIVEGQTLLEKLLLLRLYFYP